MGDLRVSFLAAPLPNNGDEGFREVPDVLRSSGHLQSEPSAAPLQDLRNAGFCEVTDVIRSSGHLQSEPSAAPLQDVRNAGFREVTDVIRSSAHLEGELLDLAHAVSHPRVTTSLLGSRPRLVVLAELHLQPGPPLGRPLRSRLLLGLPPVPPHPSLEVARVVSVVFTGTFVVHLQSS